MSHACQMPVQFAVCHHPSHLASSKRTDGEGFKFQELVGVSNALPGQSARPVEACDPQTVQGVGWFTEYLLRAPNFKGSTDRDRKNTARKKGSSAWSAFRCLYLAQYFCAACVEQLKSLISILSTGIF